jgi:CheY-like chemotaxis protein
MPAKILYVEDEIIIRVLVKRLLSEYDITVCHTGDMAMEALTKEQFDIVLIDINLGLGINGLELCKVIRTTPGYETIPIGAVTAQWINTKEELFLEGFTHYLAKPFDRDQIVQFVDEMLASRLSNANAR